LRIFLILFILIPPFLSAQGNYSFGPSIMVNDDPAGVHFHTATQRVIACQGDTIYVAWRDDRYGGPLDYNSRIFFSRSTNAGGTWNPNLMISQDSDTLEGYLPHMARAASGDICVAYPLVNDNTDNGDIYFTRSTDGGVSFTDPLIVNDSVEVISQRNSAIAVDSSGQHIYVVWEDNRFLVYDRDVYLSHSSDGGLSFLPAVRVNDDSGYTQQWFPVVACDNSGQNVYVAWEDFRDTLYGANVYFARSTDYASTFEDNYCVNDTVTTGSSNQGYPSIFFKNGIIHLVWRDMRDDYRIYYNKSEDDGASFGTDTRVCDISGWGQEPSVTADDSGRVFVVWYDFRNFSTQGYDIYFSYSNNTGLSFMPSVRVNDLLGTLSAWDMNPSVAVNANGKVFVAWDSDRNDPSHTNPDIYCAIGALTGIEETQPSDAASFSFNLHPNPFSQILSIDCQCADTVQGISIYIYDATGRLVKSSANVVGGLNSTYTWDGRDTRNMPLAQGVYFVQLKTQNQTKTGKVVLLE
jgi:hypothetical protein